MTGSRSALGEGRRLMVATAVTRHAHHPAWDRPALVKARQDIVDLFTDRFGYLHLTGLGLDPTRHQLAEGLRAVCSPAAPDPIGERDMLAVYITCHGLVLDDTGEHVLITSDTHPDDLGDALSTVDLTARMLRGTKVRRLLLMLDTCQSGRGGNEIAAAALSRLTDTWGREPGAGMVVIASAQPREEAATGMFPRLLRDAVNAIPTAGHGPDTLNVQVLVDEMNKHVARPGHQRVGIAQIGMTGQAPRFLPNPRHDVALNGVDLAIQQAAEWRAHADAREVAFREAVVRRAMGSHDGPGGGWWFTGRHAALLDLTAWLTHPDPARPLRVVTGDPGSGKSAVLGLLATLADPDRRHTVPIHSLGLPEAALPIPGVITMRLTAQHATTEQILHALAADARIDAATPGELLEGLETWERENGAPFTVLLDGLDEAAVPQDLVGRLLAPLVEYAAGRIRLLIGTRPHLLPGLAPGLHRGAEHTVADLDSERYADPDAITAYALRTMLGATIDSPYRDIPRHHLLPVAQAIAEAAQRSFLVARITATTLASQPLVTDPYDRTWRESLPRLPGEAMRRDLEIRLGGDTVRARDLLLPLAFAQGQGLPWEDIWAPLASRISERPYTDEDLLWLRDNAGSYIVENTDHGRSVYRIYHQALVEHLQADADIRRVHDAFVTVLLDRVPLASDARTDWTRTHPYTRTHVATHAAGAGRVDEIITDPEYLVHADPDTLLPALHHATGDTTLRTRAIYRNTPHRTLTPHQRRHTLAIDATRFGDTTLATELAHNLTWRPRWATGTQVSTTLRATLAGHIGSVEAVACVEVGGRPVVVTGGGLTDDTVRVWDLVDGTLRVTLTGHTGPVHAVACVEVEGRPVAVSGGTDGMVLVWDLVDGTLRAPLSEPTSPVHAVACAEVEGRPVAVTGSYDGMVRVWDLVDGTLRVTLTGHTGPVHAVACVEVEGRPVAVSGGTDGRVWVWDLVDGTRRVTLTGHTDWVGAVACVEVGGRPVAVTGGYDGNEAMVRVWDLVDGTLRVTLTGHTGSVSAVACVEVEGRPVAIAGGTDGRVWVWDLVDGTLRVTLTGHTDWVHAVACAEVEGRPVAVTGSSDQTARVWDLLASETTTSQAMNNTKILTAACAEVGGRPVAVTGRDGGMVSVWDLVDGALRATLTDHFGLVGAVACAEVEGRPVAVTGGTDGIVRVWDLVASTLRAALTGHTGRVHAIASAEVEGRPIAIIGSYDGNKAMVRVWDLVDGTLRATLTGHTGPVSAVACAEVEGRPVAVAGGSHGGMLWVWDLVDGTLRATLTGHADWVHAVACAEVEGRPVAVTGSYDGMVRVWDLVDGTLHATLTGHTGPVSAVACAEVEGRPIAVTGGTDGMVLVWDLTTWVPETLFKQNGIQAIAIGPNAEIVVTTGWDLAVIHRGEGRRDT